jgi:glycine cleavage system aminomethyltransferase T
VPRAHARDVWHALATRGGANAIGMLCREHLALEAALPSFPRDFPDLVDVPPNVAVVPPGPESGKSAGKGAQGGAATGRRAGRDKAPQSPAAGEMPLRGRGHALLLEAAPPSINWAAITAGCRVPVTVARTRSAVAAGRDTALVRVTVVCDGRGRAESGARIFAARESDKRRENGVLVEARIDQDSDDSDPAPAAMDVDAAVDVAATAGQQRELVGFVTSGDISHRLGRGCGTAFVAASMVLAGTDAGRTGSSGAPRIVRRVRAFLHVDRSPLLLPVTLIPRLDDEGRLG